MSGQNIFMINEVWVEQFFAELPDKALQFGMRVLLSAIVLLIGMQVIKIIRKIVRKSLMKASVEIGALQFLDSFIKVTLYIVLFFMIARGFGMDAASVMALLGSAGVAVGLAVQGSLSNFAGGVLILLLKPFKVGDYIKEDSKGNEGTVQEIQLFYTKLNTPDNKTIIIPNGALANNSLTNVTDSHMRRLDLVVGISYDSDIRLAKTVMTDVIEKDEKVLKDREIQVFVDNLGDSAVHMGIRCWFLNEDYWEGKWRITEEIKYALDASGIVIPFPQMNVHLDFTEEAAEEIKRM